MRICVLESIYRQCLHLGLNPDDARDCVAEVCLRYHKRTGTFPHDEETPDLCLLRLLTLNVVREHQRTQQRRQRLEQDYLAQQRQQHASAPTPMAQAIARVDCERFRAQLPDYLRRTLELMEAGDTPKAIAARLGVAVGTVYSYQRELRERFVEFFGYDPRKSGVRVVNYSGCSEASSSDNTQEVRNDATAEDPWCSGVVVSGSEPDCAARHPECSSRLTRGAAMAPAMSSSGCGCTRELQNGVGTSDDEWKIPPLNCGRFHALLEIQSVPIAKVTSLPVMTQMIVHGRLVALTEYTTVLWIYGIVPTEHFTLAQAHGNQLIGAVHRGVVLCRLVMQVRQNLATYTVVHDLHIPRCRHKAGIGDV